MAISAYNMKQQYASSHSVAVHFECRWLTVYLSTRTLAINSEKMHATNYFTQQNSTHSIYKYVCKLMMQETKSINLIFSLIVQSVQNEDLHSIHHSYRSLFGESVVKVNQFPIF